MLEVSFIEEEVKFALEVDSVLGLGDTGEEGTEISDVIAPSTVVLDGSPEPAVLETDSLVLLPLELDDIGGSVELAC